MRATKSNTWLTKVKWLLWELQPTLDKLLRVSKIWFILSWKMSALNAPFLNCHFDNQAAAKISILLIFCLDQETSSLISSGTSVEPSARRRKSSKQRAEGSRTLRPRGYSIRCLGSISWRYSPYSITSLFRQVLPLKINSNNQILTRHLLLKMINHSIRRRNWLRWALRCLVPLRIPFIAHMATSTLQRNLQRSNAAFGTVSRGKVLDTKHSSSSALRGGRAVSAEIPHWTI